MSPEIFQWLEDSDPWAWLGIHCGQMILIGVGVALVYGAVVLIERTAALLLN